MRNFFARVRGFAREHCIILGVALLLTVIIKAPVFFFPLAAGEAYRGINLYHYGNLAADEDFYMARGKEVLEGHALGNPLMREGKELYPDYYFTINETALLSPWRLVGLGDTINVATLYAAYNTVGLFALILLIYFFALELYRSKLFAVATAVFVISGYSILDHRSLFEPVFNMYGRSLHPYLSSLALFGYAILCLRSLRAERISGVVIAGIALGALSLIYSYAWTFVASFNGFLFLLFLLRRDFVSAKKILFISLVGGCIGIFTVSRTYEYLVSATGQQSIFFYGAKLGRELAYSKLGPAILILFGLLAYKKRGDSGAFVVLALLLAGFAVINQQALTGLSIQSNHYLWYYTTPSLIIALTYAFFTLARSHARTALLALGIAVSLTNSAVEQRRAFVATLPERLAEQAYRPALDALAKETKQGVVLAADEYPELLVTVYTQHDIFWESILGKFNDNPISRHADALLLYLYLNKDARDDPRAYLASLLSKGSSSFYARIYRDIEGYYSGRRGLHEYEAWSASGDAAFARHRSAILGMLTRRYEELAKDPRGFENLLDRYGIRWLLVDRSRQPEWDLSVFSGLTEIVSENNVTLFERSHSPTSASYSNDADRHHHSGAHELLAASG